MRVVLFEDRLVHQLYPVTISRPAFSISCGGYRLIDLARRLGAPVEIIVRRHLQEVTRTDHPEMLPYSAASDETVLYLNSRLVPSVSALNAIKSMAACKGGAVVRSEQGVAAMLLPPGSPRPPETADHDQWASFFASLTLEPFKAELPLFEYPHDILRHHPITLRENLEDRLSLGGYRELADGVFAADGASLGQYVVTDSRNGPILLEAGASIGPYCYLSGPAHIGANARVIEHAAIKDGVVLGHTTKVGGEVEASTIEPYTNKQHHGFLGHSYLGSWVNLGAGSCNSDLKNTYGQVSMEYNGHKVPTGMQFVGCIIGDYSKTAVNTGIFTGKVIGVCSMVYGFVTTNVPSFVNYARSFGQITEAPVEVMISTQARMFKRRNVDQRPCDIQLLRDMHELTRHERQLANEPLSL
jgi:glucose-1-phosphate thymidylyltransferase